MAGLGVQPVEGRLDAMRLDGDPDQVVRLGSALGPGSGAGVLDGYPFAAAVVISLPLIQLKRTPPSQFVRRP